MPHVVYVVSASMRPTRIGPAIAAWVVAAAPKTGDLALELVDLADWPLPMDEEPGVPAWHGHATEHTRAWSRKINEAAAFVFVTPQYNWGYPAPLKNAIDHLWSEWAGKPAVIVSYGFHGGGKCATQLRQVLEALRMRPTATMPALTLPPEMKNGAPVEAAFASFAAETASVTRAFNELTALLGEAGG